MFLKGKTAGELSVAALRRRAAWVLATTSGFEGLDEIEQIIEHLRYRQDSAESAQQAKILPLRRS